MWRIPSLAQGVFIVAILFLHCACVQADFSVDKDVEEGKAMERNTFNNMERANYGKMATLYKQSVYNDQWWSHRSCVHPYLATDLSGCSELNPQKCFGIEITYTHRVELDEHFPHWVELLRNFPKCWRFIAPLVCLVHYRPCSPMSNPNSTHYIVIELFRTQLCNRTRTHCDFALRHFPPNGASYLSCDARIKQPKSETQKGSDGLQRNGNDSLTIPVYNTNCDLNFYNVPSRKEPGQLADQAKKCLAPLVYVNTKDVTHAVPLVDECYIPCSSTLFDPNSLPVLRVFSFLCFLFVLVFGLLVLSRAKLIFDFGFLICILAIIVSTLLIALTFALSPFIGDGIVCLLGGKIRRFSGAFALAHGNDILCMMEASYLKACLVFTFWACFITVCNDFRSKPLLLQQLTALCHILISLFLTIWHQEISIDPVSKVCHYFRFHSVWLTLVDFVSLLVAASFIVFLSKTKISSKKNNKKDFQPEQMLINTTQTDNESSLRESGKSGGDQELHGEEVMAGQQSQPLLLSQRLIDALTHQISPLLLLFAYFGCVLSFYPLAENNETALLSAQINCSLSALSTGRWNDNDYLEGCQTARRVPLWYYVNSLVLAFNLTLMLAVMSASLSNLLKSNSSDVPCCEEEMGDDDDNKNEVELDGLENIEKVTDQQSMMNAHRTMNCNNTTTNYSNNNNDTYDSIYSHIGDKTGKKATDQHTMMDCNNATNLNNARKSKRRRLSNLEWDGGRNRGRTGREPLMTIGQTVVNGDPMRVNVPTPSGDSQSDSSDSLAVAYAQRFQPPFPVGMVTPPQPTAAAYAETNNPMQMNNGLAPPLSYSDAIAAAYAQVNQSSSPVGVATCPTFFGAPPQLPMTAALTSSTAPVIINHHHWYSYPPPPDNFSQNCTHQKDKVGGTEGTEKNGRDGEGKVNGTEEKAEDSEYPVSDDEEVDDTDSNDFCSDSIDSAEEFNWNESCRRAAQRHH